MGLTRSQCPHGGRARVQVLSQVSSLPWQQRSLRLVSSRVAVSRRIRSAGVAHVVSCRVISRESGSVITCRMWTGKEANLRQAAPSREDDHNVRKIVLGDLLHGQQEIVLEASCPYPARHTAALEYFETHVFNVFPPCNFSLRLCVWRCFFFVSQNVPPAVHTPTAAGHETGLDRRRLYNIFVFFDNCSPNAQFHGVRF